MASLLRHADNGGDAGYGDYQLYSPGMYSACGTVDTGGHHCHVAGDATHIVGPGSNHAGSKAWDGSVE